MSTNLTKYLKEKEIGLDVIQFFDVVKSLTKDDKFSLGEIYAVFCDKYDAVQFHPIVESLIKQRKFSETNMYSSIREVI